MKTTWKVFWDLQCPYSRKSWQRMPAIQAHFADTHTFSIHLTSLLFHRQAFTGQAAANLILKYKGPDARLRFIDACFENQDKYMKDAVGDMRPSEIDQIFCQLALDAGLLDQDGDESANGLFTREVFLAKINDWQEAVQPAWVEHKEALAYGVFGAPKHVVDEKLLLDTDSEWGPEEFEAKLSSIKKRPREDST